MCQSFCFRLLALWFHHCQRFGWVALGDEDTRLHERHDIILCQLCSFIHVALVKVDSCLGVGNIRQAIGVIL